MAKKIEWTDAARADVRRIDRETAMRILEGLARLAPQQRAAFERNRQQFLASLEEVLSLARRTTALQCA